MALLTFMIFASLGLAGCGASADDEATASPPSTAESAGAPGGGNSGRRTADGDVAMTAATAASSDGTANPCGIISRAEAEQLAGTPLAGAEAVDETCTYVAPPDGPTAQVEVRVGETAQNYYAAERDTGHQLQPLPGVGDETFVGDYAVFVTEDGFSVSVSLVRSNDPAENRGSLEDLARTVAGRL
ncbi:DUF3558 domain-containing protein [Parafrankia elaeagni]|uniref:DUF3558 domain-containing protein n=1 Tax=Parafrankia elaeagni TaxID=222534 RepID=UPI00039C7520|nr:DUF3558 domain-containing protein [Parafrankia elaeagni]